MEDGGVELRRARRRRLTTNAINRQKRIAKQAWNAEHLLKQPHRFAKRHALDCGNPKCLVCHSEKVFRKPTIQERKFLQNVQDYER
jgi:hypothetical protein